MRRRRRPTAERSDGGAVQRQNNGFRDVDSKSPFRGLPEVKIQQNIENWKVESLRNPVSKELASKDASIASYSDFESDRSAVGRLRRRAIEIVWNPLEFLQNFDEFFRNPLNSSTFGC